MKARNLIQKYHRLSLIKRQDIHIFVLAFTPISMFLFNKSAAFMIILSASVLIYELVRLKDVSLLSYLSTSRIDKWIFLLISAVLLYAMLSCLRSPNITRSFDIYAGAIITAACGTVLFTASKARSNENLLSFAVFASLFCSCLVIFEQYFGLPAHKFMGLRSEPFVLKRTTICNLLVFLSLLPFIISKFGKTACFIMVVFQIFSIYMAYSGSAAFGLLGFFLIITILRIFGPFFSKSMIIAGLIFCTIVSPFVGIIMNRYKSTVFVETLKHSHLKERIEIWNAFDITVRKATLFGHGFGSSQELIYQIEKGSGFDPELAVAENLHPHNAYLQVWVELGLIGAAAIAIILIITICGMNERDYIFKNNFGLCSCCFFIMFLSHSLWQPWWIASVFAAYTWSNLCRSHLKQSGYRA